MFCWWRSWIILFGHVPEQNYTTFPVVHFALLIITVLPKDKMLSAHLPSIQYGLLSSEVFCGVHGNIISTNSFLLLGSFSVSCWFWSLCFLTGWPISNFYGGDVMLHQSIKMSSELWWKWMTSPAGFNPHSIKACGRTWHETFSIKIVHFIVCNCPLNWPC